MKAEINLIRAITRRDLILLGLKSKIHKIASGILGLFILISLSVLMIFFILSQKLSANETKISTLKGQIVKLEKNESYLTTISNRIETINSLLKTRSSYNKAIADFKLLLIPGFSPINLEIANNGNLTIIGECSDSQILATFGRTLEQIAESGKYSKIFIPLVSRGESQEYNIYLELKR